VIVECDDVTGECDDMTGEFDDVIGESDVTGENYDDVSGR